MKQVRIKAALAAGWDATKEHIGLLLTLLIAGWVLQWALGAMGWVGSLVGVLVSVVLGVVQQLVFLKVAQGETVTFSSLSELPLTPGKVLQFLWVVFVLVLMFVAGCILFILPGIYILFRFMYAPLATLDQDLSLGEALAESTRLTKGVKWDLFLFGLAGFGLMLLGLLALIVGVIPAALTFQVASAWVYLDLKKQCDEGALPA